MSDYDERADATESEYRQDRREDDLKDTIRELEEALAKAKEKRGLTVHQLEALTAWADEADRPGGCTGWGPKFDAVMSVARELRKDGGEK